MVFRYFSLSYILSNLNRDINIDKVINFSQVQAGQIVEHCLNISFFQYSFVIFPQNIYLDQAKQNYTKIKFWQNIKNSTNC